MSETAPFAFEGDPALLPAVTDALRSVVDPEMAIDIVNLGLVYGVSVEGAAAKVRITMTSAACPVAELIVEDVGRVLSQALGEGVDVKVDLCWDPPWGPERMSPAARAAMDWD